MYSQNILGVMPGHFVASLIVTAYNALICFKSKQIKDKQKHVHAGGSLLARPPPPFGAPADKLGPEHHLDPSHHHGLVERIVSA